MAVARDTALGGELTGVSGTQNTSSFTIAANSNRVLYFWAWTAGTPPTITSANWNTSEALTQIATVASGNHRLVVYRLRNPTATTSTVSFALSGTAAELNWILDSVYNAHQSSTETTARTFSDTSLQNPMLAIGIDGGTAGGMAVGCAGFEPNSGVADIASRTGVPYYISVGTATSSAGATGLTPTGAPAGLQYGDMEFCSVATENNNTINVSGTGWAQLGSTVAADSTWQEAIFARRYDGSNVDPAFTWTGSVGCSARRFAFRDLTHSASFIGNHATANGLTTPHAITGINSTANNSDVMYVSHAEANTALGADAGYTERFDAGSATGPYRLVVGERTQATSGAGADNFSATGAAATWVMRLLECLAGTAQTHVAEVERSDDIVALALASEPSQTYNSIGFTPAGVVGTILSIGFNINEAPSSVDVAVDRSTLKLTGKTVTQQLGVVTSPGRLLLTGREVGLALGIPVTPGRLVLNGREVGLEVTGAADIDVQIDPGGLRFAGRDVGVEVGGDILVAVERGHLVFGGRAVTLAHSIPIERGHLVFNGMPWSADFDIDVTPGRLLLTGHEVGLEVTEGADINVAVQPGRLLFGGREVGVTVEQDIALEVEPGALQLHGREVTFAIATAVTPASLRLTGHEVGVEITHDITIVPAHLVLTGHEIGIVVGANIDLAIEPGGLRLTGRDVVLASEIVVEPAHLVLRGHEVEITFAGSFTIEIEPGHLVLGGRELTLEITTPAVEVPVPPIDASEIGARRKGRLYPNIKFKRRREEPEPEPPELIEPSREGLTPRPGSGLTRTGEGLASRPRAGPKPQGIDAKPLHGPPVVVARHEAPGHVDITATETRPEPSEFLTPSEAPAGPQEVFAAPRDPLAEIDALAAEMRAAAARAESEEKARARAQRNAAAIALAVKTLLGK